MQSVLSSPRRFLHAGHFITGVWFRARYVSRPGRLKRPVKISQKMSLCQVVRLGHACKVTSAIISAVSTQLNLLDLGRAMYVSSSRLLKKSLFSR